LVTVKILGGLGNQLFEYAFGRAHSLRKNTDLCLDYYYQTMRTDFDGVNLTRITDIFDLPVKLYVGKKRRKVVKQYGLNYFDYLFFAVYKRTRCFITEDNYADSLEKIVKSKNIYVDGYWQSEQYFANINDIVRDDLRFKIEKDVSSLEVYKKITQSNSIGIHIRGKDYINHPWYEALAIKYYIDGINFISKTNPDFKVFIFTDDIEHVCKNLKELLSYSEIVKVNSNFNSDAVDLLLMSKCRHNIICNSSFSWWGAWLNNNSNKIVVAPSRWFKRQSPVDGSKIIPNSWHKIANS